MPENYVTVDFALEPSATIPAETPGWVLTDVVSALASPRVMKLDVLLVDRVDRVGPVGLVNGYVENDQFRLS